MSNLLKMAVSETIRTLHRRGWSQRRIADELGINRETVARHLRQAEQSPKAANVPFRLRRPTAREDQPMRPRLDAGADAAELTVAPPARDPIRSPAAAAGPAAVSRGGI